MDRLVAGVAKREQLLAMKVGIELQEGKKGGNHFVVRSSEPELSSLTTESLIGRRFQFFNVLLQFRQACPSLPKSRIAGEAALTSELGM